MPFLELQVVPDGQQYNPPSQQTACDRGQQLNPDPSRDGQQVLPVSAHKEIASDRRLGSLFVDLTDLLSVGQVVLSGHLSFDCENAAATESRISN